MKKIILVACAICFVFGNIYAQQVQGESVDSVAVALSEEEVEASPTHTHVNSYRVGYNVDYDIFRAAVGLDKGKYGYFVVEAGIGTGDVSMFDASVGFGLKKRCNLGDEMFMMGTIYPYIGVSETSFDMSDLGLENVEDTEFIWGAAAGLEMGINVWKTKSGNSFFLTLGYHIDARELKVDDLLDNGRWSVGLTVFRW